jgi:sialic acid synthase SpsE
LVEENLDVKYHKVASALITDKEFLLALKATGKPVIVSTGMASLSDIENAVNIFKQNNCPICLLKCTSSYPAPPEQANLLTIPHLRETFNCPSGLSDHTLGPEVPIVATALGGCIIEKHFTLDRSCGSPDDGFSLEPNEFRQMVDSVKTTWLSLGQIHYGGVSSEKDMRKFRRSLFTVKDVKQGEIVSYDNVKSIRPGNGLDTKHWEEVKGMKFRNDLTKGTPLNFSFLE